MLHAALECISGVFGFVYYVVLGIALIMLYVFTLEMIYQTDELAELINRRGFENYISHIDESCAIIFFDVDKFKEMNDNYGHAAGDKMLHEISQEALYEEWKMFSLWRRWVLCDHDKKYRQHGSA